MPYAQAGEIRLYYETVGDGPPLLMLHGNGEDRTVFRRQTAAFSRRYTLYLPDSRGHGLSDSGEQPLTYELMARDTIAFMDALGIEKAFVLGFSDGGNIALEMALLQQQRIEKMVVVGANIFPGGLSRRSLLGIQVMSALSYLFARGEKGRLRYWRLHLMAKYPQIAPEQLADVVTQTLVLAGEHDMVLRLHSQLIADSLKNGQLGILAGCGHFAPEEKPEYFNEMVSDFFDGLLGA